jgi:hypothetical protein
MSLTWNNDIIRQIYEEGATRLLAASKVLQNEDRSRRGIVNPAPRYRSPAPRGQYPHLRRNRLRAGIIGEPQTIREIVSAGLRVRVGYMLHVKYGADLEKKGWKGIRDTAADIEPQLLEILQSGRVIH